MGQLEGLCLDPSEGFQVLQQEVVFGQRRRQLDAVVTSPLWYPCNSLNFLDLLIVWRRGAIQEGSYLRSEVSGSDECAQDVLRQHVSKGCRVVLDIIVGNIDVLQTKR